MKPGIFFIILFLSTITFAGLNTHRLYLSGTVRFQDTRSDERLEGLEILAIAEGYVLAGAVVDSSGRYALSFIPEHQDTFHFYYFGNGFDTTWIKSFTRFEDQIMEWDIVL